MNESDIILSPVCLCGCGQKVKFNRDSKLPNKYISGHNKSSVGIVRSEETKKKISESLKGKVAWNKDRKMGPSWNSGLVGCQVGWNKGKHWPEEMKRKLSDSHKGQVSGMLGKHHSEKTRNRLRISSTGHIHSDEQKKKIGDSHRGKFVSDDTRRKMRITTLKRIDIQYGNGEPTVPCIGTEERNCLDELEAIYNIHIVRNDPRFRYIVGRYPDGHIPDLKLFIQFDEKHHFLDKACKIYKQDDIDCTLQLASLGYIVFRISELDWKENKDKILNNFNMVVL